MSEMSTHSPIYPFTRWIMKKSIDNILGGFLALLMAIITVDVLWGVFTRYALGSQAAWSEELARFLLIWIGVLGAAYASGQGMHLSIDLLQPKMQPENRRKLQNLIHVIIAVFVFAVFVVGGGRLIYITHHLGQLSPALRVPMSVVYLAIPLAGLLIVFYKIQTIMRNVGEA